MAMAAAKASLDYWRNVFGASKYDIFELIDKAILVAAVDYPNEFKNRKNLIVEKFCASRPPLCSECDQAEHQVPINGDDDDDDEYHEEEKKSSEDSDNPEKFCASQPPRRVSINGDDDEYREEEKKSSDDSDNPEERLMFGEVMRIKEVLCRHQEESDSVLYESLCRLQLMKFSVEILKETEIGKTVNALRKQKSGHIRKLARTLIHGWRALVDEWVKPTAAVTQITLPDSVNKTKKPSVTEFAGLGCSSNRAPEQKPSSHFSAGVKRKKSEEDSDASKKKLHEQAENAKKRRMIHIIKLRGVGSKASVTQSTLTDSVNKTKKPSVTESAGLGCSSNRAPEQKPRSHFSAGVKRKKSEEETKKPSVTDSAGLGCSSNRAPEEKPSGHFCAGVKRKQWEEDSDAFKLEIAKRKLHEGYQRAGNAKNQRMIQIIELSDLPMSAGAHDQKRQLKRKA